MHVNPSEFSQRDDLIGICLDFFEAGGDTVASSLSWLFMYMALNPNVQDRCYNELLEKLGKGIRGNSIDSVQNWHSIGKFAVHVGTSFHFISVFKYVSFSNGNSDLLKV